MSAAPYQAPKNGFRTFLIVWLTQSISVFGSALTMFAINIWMVTVLYPSPEQKAQLAGALVAVNLAFTLPSLAIAPFAGAWADRHDRKMTMFWWDCASFVLSLVLTVLLGTHNLRLWMLLIGAVINALAATFHGSAFDTAYAMLVPDHQLPRANGMMQTMWALSGVLSPALAAFLIALPALARDHFALSWVGGLLSRLSDGMALATGIDAVTFLLAAGALLFLHIPSPQRADLVSADGTKTSIWADVKVGALYIWRRRPLLWLLGTFTVANFCGQIGLFMPLLVKFNLATDWAAHGYSIETAMAMLNSVFSIGGVVGGFAVSLWGGLKRRRVYGVLVPLLFNAVIEVFIGYSSLLYVTAALLLLDSATFPASNVHSQTIWQTQVPRELQGRVFSVRRVIAQCSGPIGVAVAGWLAGHFNPGHVLSALGIFSAVFFLVQLFNPYLLQVENKEYLDQMAAVEG